MIPLWLKIVYLIFLLILIPVYYKHRGLANFLWFSDLALLGSGLALWLESSFIASVLTITVLVPEIFWNIEYFLRVITRKRILGLTDYMFDKSKPGYLRGLSLYHIALPVVLIYLLIKLGYDPMAIYYQPFFAWIVLLLSYFFTAPDRNINFVFGIGSKPQKKISRPLYFLSILLLFPVVVFIPTHFLLSLIFN